MAIINATPHPIVVRTANNEVFTFEPSGFVARVQSNFSTSLEVEKFETFTIEYGEITGLPEKIDEKDFVIVSSLVLEAAKASRHPLASQLLAPATGHPQVARNEKGHILNVPGFVRA